MIGYLRGKIVSVKPTRLILDVNGVGYALNISIATYEKISDSKEAELHTYLVVKDDALDLYGFYNEEEKEMFELLIGVSGVGPKTALGILSGIRAGEIKRAIITGDVSKIVSAPGIGRKTAERLILELKDKIKTVGEPEQAAGLSDISGDAIAALVNLGYNQKTAEKAVRAALDKNPSIALEDLIKEALSGMMR
ncbi:holliday junction DNA helicase ruva [Melioribacter roseus P3M-2]|uniref:Holliday junction branch migration complex subunit RuvA n=1 Tax=Melioribacter roseus (strain DSM 23840 / JCM 17771 / VKM B-2668 / P3M-2) TaxID=1191523 RepID=I6Z4D1_MELRP|nr:Holliday junction branch migration protein RuvA [Melioribacter roseus]AFN73985.1 holliday junction DNA helicase ruva [Melioribacter roseus P3M-2]